MGQRPVSEWHVMIDGVPHHVRAELSGITGSFTLEVDGEKRAHAGGLSRAFSTAFQHALATEVAGHRLEVTAITAPASPIRYYLTIDGAAAPGSDPLPTRGFVRRNVLAGFVVLIGAVVGSQTLGHLDVVPLVCAPAIFLCGIGAAWVIRRRTWPRLPQAILASALGLAIPGLFFGGIWSTTAYAGTASTGGTAKVMTTNGGAAVAEGWTSIGIPFARGDTWPGNAISDGVRLYLISREEASNGYGTIRFRWTPDAGATWSEPATFTKTLSGTQPRLAMTRSGQLWAAYVQAASGSWTLYVRHSEDHGITWSGQVAVTDGTFRVGLPELLVSGSSPLIAYTNGDTGALFVRRLGTDGKPAAEPVKVGETNLKLYSNSDLKDARVSMASDGSKIVVAWWGDKWAAYSSTSTDHGETWTYPAILSSVNEGSRPVDLAFDGTRFTAVTTEWVGAANRFQVNELALDENDGTWKAVGQLSHESAGAFDGTLVRIDGLHELAYTACTADGCVSDAGKIWYRESKDGTTWSTQIAISAVGNAEVIGIGSVNGHAWVIWRNQPTDASADRSIEGAIRTSPNP